MEGENEVTVVVENPTAEIVAATEAHAETTVAVVELEQAARVEIAEIEAAAVVAVAEAQAEGNVAGLEAIIARLDNLTAENAALRSELSELRAVLESAADDIEDELREEIRAEINDDIIVAEDEEALKSSEEATPVVDVPDPGEHVEETHTRKRHFVSL